MGVRQGSRGQIGPHPKCFDVSDYALVQHLFESLLVFQHSLAERTEPRLEASLNLINYLENIQFCRINEALIPKHLVHMVGASGAVRKR